MQEAAEDALDQMQRPDLDLPGALTLAERLYGLRGGSATTMVSYDDCNFWLRPQEVFGNPHLAAVCPDGYTLKATNSKDSLETDFIEGQNQLLLFLADNGVRCPRPVRNKHGETFSIERFRKDGPGHAVRLLEFIPGEILGKVPWQADFATHAGREVARINTLMDRVNIPALLSRKTEWSLWEAPRVLNYVDFVTDSSKRSLVEEVLGAFEKDVRAHAEHLQRDTGLIHGDFNQFNIVVGRRDGRRELTGVLDLGDCHVAPRLFEVAVAATYMALTSGDVQAVGDVLAGYCSVRPLVVEDADLLRVCVCARLCQSLVMGLRGHSMDPDNTYILDSQEKGWPLLEQLWRAPPGSFEQAWASSIKV